MQTRIRSPQKGEPLVLTPNITLLVVMAWGFWVLTGGRLHSDSRMRVLLTMGLAFYVSQLLAWTLFPLPIDESLIEQQRALADAGLGRRGNNLTPFETLRDASRSDFVFLTQIGGNFLLLAPLGFLAPLLWNRFATFCRGAGLVVATTLAIEFSQLGISGILGFTYRSFDVDDLWLNALGGSLAVVAGLAVRRVLGETNSGWIGGGEVGDQEEGSDAAGAPLTTGLRETALYRSEP